MHKQGEDDKVRMTFMLKLSPNLDFAIDNCSNVLSNTNCAKEVKSVKRRKIVCVGIFHLTRSCKVLTTDPCYFCSANARRMTFYCFSISSNPLVK